MKNNLVLVLFLVILVAIFWLSNKDASASNMQSNTLLVKLGVVTEEEMIERTPYAQKMKSVIRDLAHFSIYLLLGMVTYLVFVVVLKQEAYPVLKSMLFLLVYAFFDEVHQFFIPGRSFQLIDIRTDFMGGSLGVVGIMLFYKWSVTRKMVNSKKKHIK